MSEAARRLSQEKDSADVVLPSQQTRVERRRSSHQRQARTMGSDDISRLAPQEVNRERGKRRQMATEPVPTVQGGRPPSQQRQARGMGSDEIPGLGPQEVNQDQGRRRERAIVRTPPTESVPNAPGGGPPIQQSQARRTRPSSIPISGPLDRQEVDGMQSRRNSRARVVNKPPASRPEGIAPNPQRISRVREGNINPSHGPQEIDEIRVEAPQFPTLSMARMPGNRDRGEPDTRSMGYREYSSTLASDSDFLIFKRFGTSSARVLLALQDDVLRKEMALARIDDELRNSSSAESREKIHSAQLGAQHESDSE
jgi:hypothetical protein